MRIVSLCPSLTELVFTLGRGSELVGRTRYCVRPAGEVTSVPVVGGTKDPDAERIAELRPDLVLLNQEENRREDAEQLAALGIRCIASFPRTVAGAAELVRELGRALERPARAEALAREIELHAATTARRAARHRPVPFLYLIWRKPWMAVNGDTYIHSLLQAAGGVNVCADRPQRYPPITGEELAALDPRLVLLSSEPFPFAERHRQELAAATGLPAGRFVLCDGQRLSWHGALTAAGLAYAKHLFEGARRPLEKAS